MKKKTLLLLLVTAMTVSVFTGCGNRMEGDGKVQAAMADAGNSQEENSGVPESEANEAESSEQTPEPTVEPTPEATAEPTAESTVEPASEAVNTTEAGTADGSSDNTAVKDEETDYTFTELNETMYAKCTVNLRDLPTSTDSEKIGKLADGQEVKVTGQCVETKWYRIELEDETIAYVSNSYIVKDKSQVAGFSSDSGKTTDGNKTGNAQTQAGNKTGSTGQTSSQGSGSGDSQASGRQTQQSSTGSGQSSSFVDYLNQQRAAAGLSQVSWDSDLASRAEGRAKDISTNFDHDNATDVLENILGNPSSDVSGWFDQWYNSEVHRLSMMNPNITTVGCGYYSIDGYYYVVLLMKVEIPVQSAEEWNATKEERIESGEIHQMESVDDNGGGWNSYGTEGVDVLTEEDPEYDEVMSWDWG